MVSLLEINNATTLALLFDVFNASILETGGETEESSTTSFGPFLAS